jgi:hypothetical protein
LLSTVRYPNHKVRRAYMRFFAWMIIIIKKINLFKNSVNII